MMMLPYIRQLQQSLGNTRALKVLDLGQTSKSHISSMIELVNPGTDFDSYGMDLRYDFAETKHEAYDVIIFTEVIEHIKDRDTPGDIEATACCTYSGVESVLRNIRERLEPHGFMILTTPNVCNWKALHNILMYEHPFTYKPHPRELTDADCRKFIEGADLKIVEGRTVDVWGNHGFNDSKYIALRLAVQALGYSVDNREDDLMYIVARK